MQKIFVILCAIFLVNTVFAVDGGYFIGDGGNGKRVLVYSSVIENGKESDLWIAQKIKRDSFSLAATITNIETGRTEGSFTSDFYAENDFITKAHGEATTVLFESLGVNLTAAGKRLLQYGSFTETAEESAENLEIYKAELARLEHEQAELMKNRSTEIDLEAQNTRIELQKQILSQQQKQEEERLARLREDEKRKSEEERLSKERSSESQKKIVALTKEIEEKAAKIRQKKIDNMSVMQQIDVIEGEKQILLANENSIEENILAFNRDQDYLCGNEIKERRERKPRKTEMNSDGSLNDAGKAILESDLNAILQKYEKIKTENEAQVRTSAKVLQENLRSKILSDIETLESKTFKSDSLQNSDIYFRIGEYDGSLDVQGWHYSISFMFAGSTVFTRSGILSYKQVTGKDVPKYPKADESNREEKIKRYEEYQDNVEAYDSFFRMNVPYIRAMLSYSIKVDEWKNASHYFISVDRIDFFNVQTEIAIAIITPQYTLAYSYNPSTYVNWNLEGARIKQERKDSKIAKKEEKKEKVRQAAAGDDWAYQELGYGGITGLGINFGNFDDSFLCNIYGDFSLSPYLFLDIGFFYSNAEINKNYPSYLEFGQPMTFGIQGGLGLNRRIHILDIFHPNFYFTVDAGYAGTLAKLFYYDVKKDVAQGESTFLAYSVGMTAINIFQFTLDMRYSVYQLLNYDNDLSHSFSAGIRWILPTVSLF